jgi:hypothetical protein
MDNHDLSVIDPFERTTQYSYYEIFKGGVYDHPQIKLPPAVEDYRRRGLYRPLHNLGCTQAPLKGSARHVLKN